jgi:hypothetical protein
MLGAIKRVISGDNLMDDGLEEGATTSLSYQQPQHQLSLGPPSNTIPQAAFAIVEIDDAMDIGGNDGGENYSATGSSISETSTAAEQHQQQQPMMVVVMDEEDDNATKPPFQVPSNNINSRGGTHNNTILMPSTSGLPRPNTNHLNRTDKAVKIPVETGDGLKMSNLLS